MKNIPFFTILIITSLCIIIAQGKLGEYVYIDYVTIEGLEYFKSHNLSSPSSALNSINSTALKALKNNQPYSVINTTVTPPNNNKQEYISYAPYFWPFCGCDGKNVTDPETQCLYKQIDGKVNGDVEILSDPHDSTSMVRDVLSLSISYLLYNDEDFAKKAVELLDVWFVNNKTRMFPDVNYGQVVRGPGEWKGRPEGILDTRLYVYIPAAIRILTNSNTWNHNDNIDKGVKTWFANFSNWLMKSELGKNESNAENNHATFYVAQLATYLNFTGRTKDANDLIGKFANTTFKDMILESGEQPKESSRRKPYHYQCFNLEALTYIAIFSQKINGTTNLWETKTKYNATIQNATDYLIHLNSTEDKTVLLPALYKVRDYYGDKFGVYADTMIKLLKETAGDSKWWTVYSPKSL
ncbi:hypothetical protein RclHR1_02620024 [Rhizophagus clarus]|uniref:Chondroitin AC/alginate lyase n=1 Tax=Rhizophagus clarus TaxID=94130 RepID=A0A2Z6R089_9GLOM|nr:hypothetical protein RclHR1_02620024 [Rhizophagus clarus]GES89305.1 chondroitin AC/alginate lyase [Rhizophagus clarus]